MYYLNQARSLFGYGTRNQRVEADEIMVDSTSSEEDYVDDGYGPSHDPYFNGYMDIDKIKERLVDSKWPQEDQKEFIKYCKWCIRRLEKGGLQLQSKLADANGELNDKFAQMVNERICNRAMSCSDASSRKARNDCAVTWRFVRGLTPLAGYAPEKGRDCVSTMKQTVAYMLLPVAQYVRDAAGGIVAYGQYHDEYPIRNATIQNTELSWLYEGAANTLIITTFVSLVPIFFLHTPAQLREFCRGYAELNVNELSALHCYKDAVKFMCEGGDEFSIQNLRYKFGMESYKKRTTKTATYDAARYFFSILRETVAYPENVVLSGFSNITLATGQAFGTPGAMLLAAGVFATLQNIFDKAQGWCENRSAKIKLDDLEDTLNKLNVSYRDHLKTEQANLRNCVNSAAITFLRRQRQIQGREYWFGIARIMKGLASSPFGVLSIIHGYNQLKYGTKPPLYLFVCSLCNIFLSGTYFWVALKKMLLRNSEKMMKKDLVRDAEFVRLQFEKEDRLEKQASSKWDRFLDREHLFQHGKVGVKKSRDIRYEDNEHILLDIVTDYILENIQKTKDPSDLQFELTKWLNRSWGASESMISATLKACADKAPKFQREQLKQGLASLLNLVLPLGADKNEKRIKPSLVVLSKMQYMEVDDSDQGKSFQRIVKENAGIAPSKAILDLLLRGVKNHEEFIASVLHVFERSTPPDRLNDDWIKFAKLVALAKRLEQERLNSLKAVSEAEYKDFNMPDKGLLESFAEFKKAVDNYANTSIFNRAKQLDHLKELSRNDFMQELLDKVDDMAWMAQVGNRLSDSDRNLLRPGIQLLTDRVDVNQPLPPNMPASPRSRDIQEAPQSVVTRIPRNVRIDQSEDASDVSARKPARRGQRRTKTKGAANPSNHSDNRPKESVSSSASTQKTSTSRQKSSFHTTDEHALVEVSATETVITVSTSDSEGEATQEHLHTPRGIQEV